MWRRTARRGRLIAVATLITASAVMATPASATPALDEQTARTEAVFEGRIIDMSNDWGEARACMVWPEELDRPECFRTEAEMDARIAELEAPTRIGIFSTSARSGDRAATRGTNCSGYLRLYDGTSYTGAALYARGRYQWLDLAAFNFNNRTSSFKIGPCSAYFADLSGGGGAWYPTADTQAYDVATAMVRGWNNDVSSFYIS